MRILKTSSLLTMLFLFLFSNGRIVFASPQDNPLIKAIQLFDKGNFTEAEPILNNLLAKSPDNLMINYYYAACRSENLYFGYKEINFLLKASKVEAPLKADYYLAMQYHALEQWEEALKFYNRYKQKVDSNAQNLVELNKKIQQCFNNENPYSEIAKEINLSDPDTLISAPETNVDSVQSSDSIQTDTSEIKTTEIAENEILLPEMGKKTETENGVEPINFPVNSEIVYSGISQFKTREGSEFYKNAVEKQNELTENLQKTENLRKSYNASVNMEEKNAIGRTILQLEEESYILKEKIENLLSEAKIHENNFWNNASEEEKVKFIQAGERNHKNSEITNIPEEKENIDPDLLFVRDKTTEETATAFDDEMVYKIQIGAFSKGLPNYIKILYKKLSLIRKIENYTDNNGVVIYTTGNLTNLEDAVKMQKQVRQEGVEDAFIVPYFNGKRITLERAKEIVEGK